MREKVCAIKGWYIDWKHTLETRHCVMSLHVGECFQSKKIVSNILILFPIWFLCFQSKLFVFNLKISFPMSFFVLFCTYFVSNLFLCFQSNLFPIYVSNLHITILYKCLGLLGWHVWRNESRRSITIIGDGDVGDQIMLVTNIVICQNVMLMTDMKPQP